MTDLVNNLAHTAPELVLMFLFVLMFLRAMAARDRLFTETISQISDRHRVSMEDISRQHLEAREQSRQAIEQNTLKTMEATKAIGNISAAVSVWSKGG